MAAPNPFTPLDNLIDHALSFLPEGIVEEGERALLRTAAKLVPAQVCGQIGLVIPSDSTQPVQLQVGLRRKQVLAGLLQPGPHGFDAARPPETAAAAQLVALAKLWTGTESFLGVSPGQAWLTMPALDASWLDRPGVVLACADPQFPTEAADPLLVVGMLDDLLVFERGSGLTRSERVQVDRLLEIGGAMAQQIALRWEPGEGDAWVPKVSLEMRYLSGAGVLAALDVIEAGALAATVGKVLAVVNPYGRAVTVGVPLAGDPASVEIVTAGSGTVLAGLAERGWADADRVAGISRFAGSGIEKDPIERTRHLVSRSLAQVRVRASADGVRPSAVLRATRGGVIQTGA